MPNDTIWTFYDRGQKTIRARLWGTLVCLTIRTLYRINRLRSLHVAASSRRAVVTANVVYDWGERTHPFVVTYHHHLPPHWSVDQAHPSIPVDELRAWLHPVRVEARRKLQQDLEKLGRIDLVGGTTRNPLGPLQQFAQDELVWAHANMKWGGYYGQEGEWSKPWVKKVHDKRTLEMEAPDDE